MNYYKSDLAYIHDDGFGQFAKAAARTLIAELQSHQLLEGTVLDLGCGSGTAAQIFTNYGYQVIGLDISKDFIRIARERFLRQRFMSDRLLELSYQPVLVYVPSVRF